MAYSEQPIHLLQMDQPHTFFLFLTEAIQLFALNKYPSILTIKTPFETEGTITIVAGHVVHAECEGAEGGCVEGELALYTMLRWKEGKLNHRRLKDAYKKTISLDLSPLLFNAYDHVMMYGPLMSTSSYREDVSLEESTSTLNDTQPPLDKSKISNFLKLLWIETLKNELELLDGFMSFQLMDPNDDGLNTNNTLEYVFNPLAENIFQALIESGVHNEKLELYLSLPTSYHTFHRLPSNHLILYTVFERQEITPAMLQFNLKKIMDKLSFINVNAPSFS